MNIKQIEKRLDRVIYENDDHFAVFVAICDESLQEIKDNPNILLNPMVVRRFMNEEGDNIHFLFIQNKGGMFRARKYIEPLLKRFKTVSWCNKSINKILSFERRI